MIHLNDHPDFGWVQIRDEDGPPMAKTAVGRESFWLKNVTHHRDDIYTAVVDNDLIFTDQHGLSVGDVVSFEVSEL